MKYSTIIVDKIYPIIENSLNKNYTCYFNSSRDLCIWKIE